MAVNKFILIAILLGFVVSWVPRVLPFVLVKYKGLTDIVVRFLHYLPVSILFALILSSLTTEKIGHLPQFKGSLSTIVGDEKLTSREDRIGPLFMYVQCDEDTFLKVDEVSKTEAQPFDVFNQLVSSFQFCV